MHRFANRPYTVLGRSFVPATTIEPYRARGLASWYGRKFHGQPTSTGEPYDMYGMTAAHPTLPIPSYVRVTNLSNGRTVVVRVNDRGPFHKGRLIDLSYTAAYKLGYVKRGSTQVEVESILPDEIPLIAAKPGESRCPRKHRQSKPCRRSQVRHSLPPWPRRPRPGAADRGASECGPGRRRDGRGVSATQGLRLPSQCRRVSRPRGAGNEGTRRPARSPCRGGRYRLHLGPFETVDAARRDAERLCLHSSSSPLSSCVEPPAAQRGLFLLRGGGKRLPSIPSTEKLRLMRFVTFFTLLFSSVLAFAEALRQSWRPTPG